MPQRSIPALVILALLATTLFAAPAQQPAQPSSTDATAMLPATFEATDLARLVSRDPARLTPKTHADGSSSLDLGGGFGNVLVVETTADGKPRVSCITSQKHARRLFDGMRATSKKEK